MRGVSPLLLFILLAGVSRGCANGGEETDTAPLPSTHGSIGGVVDCTSRVGKEQKVAMKMAVRDICGSGNCSKRLRLHVRNSGGSPARTAASTIELVDKRRAQAVIGTVIAQEIVVLTDINRNIKDLPIISLASPAVSLPRILHDQLRHFLQMSDNIKFHVQCIAAIVSHFGWRTVTAIYEESNILLAEPGIITLLSDSLEAVHSEIERYTAIPYSLSNQEIVIEQELKKLKNHSNRVFILVRSSLELAKLVFVKAKQMSMMEKGYVWIVADEVASLLDSVDSSVLNSMQGVIGFRTHFHETTESFKKFKHRFRKEYRSEFPQEEENSCPSIFALRAYDATWAISQAMEKSPEAKITSKSILSSKFEGLNGKVQFMNNALRELPLFDIINVVGKSYRNVALWSPAYGFKNNTVKDFGPIFWPGGNQAVPRGCADKRLKIGVPSGGAFHQFVNVNGTNISGFSIKVFEAAVKRLHYDLQYDFVPFNGTYDDMIQQVVNQSFDAVVGDTEILSERNQEAQFSLPYIDSGVVMIVTQKSEMSSPIWMLKAFTPRLWLLMATLHLLVGFVVWLIERDENSEFTGIGSMLWFCVTIIFHAQREQIKSNLAKLVLAPWLFVILIVTTSFTASLTSMMTLSRLRPSFPDIEKLKATNAIVGCNGNSFIVQYLTRELLFKAENIKKIYDGRDYPEVLRNGSIKAAFLVEPHARVFLKEHCNGYTIAGATHKLGGLGFVFQKGAQLGVDISEALLESLEKGEIKRLEEKMLFSLNCKSSTQPSGDPALDTGPFVGMFAISGGLAGIGFLVTVVRMTRKLHMLTCFRNALMNTTWRWPRTQF